MTEGNLQKRKTAMHREALTVQGAWRCIETHHILKAATVEDTPYYARTGGRQSTNILFKSFEVDTQAFPEDKVSL